jgi:predicted glycogen debranching enzyme
LRTVLGAHLDGVRYGIHATDDGLLTQGVDGEALTWMDARVDGVAVTPRIGKAVEVNALWINALASVAALSVAARQRAVVRHSGRSVDIDVVLDAARSAFAARFPHPDGTLADLVDGPNSAGRAATQVRPNQLLAWSLPYAPRLPDREALVRIGAALLTPLGLRSLDPADPDYRSRHRGGPADRDHAYHQGTVWPWLIGPYVDACRCANQSAWTDGRRCADQSAWTDALFIGLIRHLADFGLGSVSETADGAAPHAGTGCPFQAWSVAEMLRVGSRSPDVGPDLAPA